ncbi:MAG: ATP-dependent DNA helicase RecG [Janthinobacterium lividum]
MALTFSTPVKELKRVGERVAPSLVERGVETVEDLLYHLPFRYEDRAHPKPLSDYQVGDMASIVGEVRGTVLLRTRSKPIFEMTVGIRQAEPIPTESGNSVLTQPPVLETIKCLWFGGTYLRDRFQPGQTVALYGKLDGSRSGSAPNAAPGSTKWKMVQPTFEILPDANATGEQAEFVHLEMGRLVPVYESLGGTTPLGGKLGSRWLRRVLWTLFRELEEAGLEAEETLPRALIERLGLPSRMQALRDLHFPPADTSLTDLQGARTAAHRRLIFEELWYLELGLELKRRRLREREGTAFVTDDRVREALKQILPFKPTKAQKRVLGEIVADMREPRPMRRLLQGDVGSGKTIVALEAALVAIENGYQVAMMAPTEILATQHYLSARKLLADATSPSKNRGYRITLLTGSLDTRSKKEAHGRIFRGETDLAIGTHALVEEKVDFDNLGLVIMDEQHRFGVQQRYKLMRKPGPNGVATEPDVLVMTATPIPRTLALTIYGDLEASILDELPPGRTPITTRRMPAERAEEVWAFVRKQVIAGRQAYIVCPIIEGEKDDQAELDFARDAGEPASTRVSSSSTTRSKSSAGTTAQMSGSQETTASNRKSVKTGTAANPRLFASLASAAETVALRRSPTKRPSKKSAGKSGTGEGSPARAKLRSAVEMYEELGAGALAGLRLGLLHGRMSADDKEVTMARFKRGELDVLVATTVIEVGVDVPNATVMVIEHAERFGLAQMHQLRGRVGRGQAKSFCVLLTGERVTPEAEARLDAMVQTQDGFELAELDLAQRGPGEFFGTRQAGLPDLRVANLSRDRKVLELAKIEAARFAQAPDPQITDGERGAVWSRLKQQWQRRYGLVEA